MRTEKSNFETKTRGKCYSDKALWTGFKNSTLIRDLLMGKREAPYKVASLWFDFNRAMFTFCGKVPTCINFGSQKLGWCFLGIIVLTQLCLNSVAVPLIFKPVAAYGTILLPIWYSGPELLDMFVFNTHSKIMTIYTAICLLMGITHLIRLWFVKDIHINSSGESLLHKGLTKAGLEIDPSIVAYVEAFVFLSFGILCWRYWNDPYFGFFLIVVGVSSWSSEFAKNADIEHQKSISAL